MVTAGIYLVGRMDFLFVLLPEVGQVVGFVAAATALLSGFIAVGQWDIKKVLAYSTVSQLGFMFCGMATTVWTTGLFHVVTHAFFKALLFLGAGAVIHALHHEQDIRKMGGLWKDLRLVSILFIVGSLALAGVPPFAGFFSKDEIVGAVHLAMTHEGGLWPAVFVMLVVSATLTAFYTTRLVMLTFFGPPADAHRHVHPIHWTMTSVLVVLAVLSTIGGALAGPLDRFVEPIWSVPAWREGLHHEGFDPVAVGVSVFALVVGGGLGFVMYGPQRAATAALIAGPLRVVQLVLENKFYVDELYDTLIVKPIGALAQVLFTYVDRWLIDWFTVEGAGNGVVQIGAVLRRTQVGAIGVATMATLVGTVLVLLWMTFHG
jgi:NADH-quinone oxidoreductase subunit L